MVREYSARLGFEIGRIVGDCIKVGGETAARQDQAHLLGWKDIKEFSLVAAIIADKRAVINSGLYWTGVANVDEAYYLCAILNSPTVYVLRQRRAGYS